jgi:uncharacterized protein YdaU (DUF1376 family)
MTTRPPWMPLYIADYRRDTAHLSPAQHGGYVLLIMHYWAHGKLPDDDAQLRNIACMDQREWNRHRAVLQAFFQDGWKHKRIEAELAKAKAKQNKRQEAGKRGGIAKAKGWQNPSNATVLLEQNPSNALASSSHSERKKDTADAVPTAYAFESGVIRLVEKDLQAWKAAYSHLDVPAELIGLTEWAGNQGDKWFFAVSGALTKRNRAAKIAASREQSNFKWNGIEGVI